VASLDRLGRLCRIRFEEFLDDMGQVDDFGIGSVEPSLVEFTQDKRGHPRRIEPTDGVRFLHQRGNNEFTKPYIICFRFIVSM